MNKCVVNKEHKHSELYYIYLNINRTDYMFHSLLGSIEMNNSSTFIY